MFGALIHVDVQNKVVSVSVLHGCGSGESVNKLEEVAHGHGEDAASECR